MSMIRWEPFPELMSLRQAMDRLFEDSFIRPSRLAPGEGPLPAIDMYQTPKEVVVKVQVPGIKLEDIDVHITGDGLTIKGERKSEKETKREDYYYQEQRYGSFTRYVSLPDGLATDKAEASLEDGVLTLTIPKAEGVKPKPVKIKKAKASEPKQVEAAVKKEEKK